MNKKKNTYSVRNVIEITKLKGTKQLFGGRGWINRKEYADL